MSPISQSQFIPLGEVLLLAISAMNSAHKSVTQETLTEHLQTCFPGNNNLHSNTNHVYYYNYYHSCIFLCAVLAFSILNYYLDSPLILTHHPNLGYQQLWPFLVSLHLLPNLATKRILSPLTHYVFSPTHLYLIGCYLWAWCIQQKSLQIQICVWASIKWIDHSRV